MNFHCNFLQNFHSQSWWLIRQGIWITDNRDVYFEKKISKWLFYIVITEPASVITDKIKLIYHKILFYFQSKCCCLLSAYVVFQCIVEGKRHIMYFSDVWNTLFANGALSHLKKLAYFYIWATDMSINVNTYS